MGNRKKRWQVPLFPFGLRLAYLLSRAFTFSFASSSVSHSLRISRIFLVWFSSATFWNSSHKFISSMMFSFPALAALLASVALDCTYIIPFYSDIVKVFLKKIRKKIPLPGCDSGGGSCFLRGCFYAQKLRTVRADSSGRRDVSQRTAKACLWQAGQSGGEVPQHGGMETQGSGGQTPGRWFVPGVFGTGDSNIQRA